MEAEMQVNIMIAGLVSILCSTAVYAEYDADELGKLFTDKTQRTQIDAARSGNYSGKVPEQADKVNMSGYLKRSDGKNVVWVNGENTLESSEVGSVKVYPKAIDENDNKVPVSVDGNRLYLRPGESWSKSTGKVKENY